MQAKYAGFGIRLAAHLIDFAITELAALLLTYAALGVVFVFAGMHGSVSDAVGPVAAQVILGIAETAITVPYYVIGHFRFGTTLGKFPFGIYVVDAKTLKPISLKQSWVRCFAYVISYLPLLCGFLMAAFQPRKQALHDLIAGTVSVRRARGFKPAATLRAVPVAFALLAFASAAGARPARADDDANGPLEAPNFSQELLLSYLTQQSEEYGAEAQLALLYHPSSVHAVHYGAHLGAHHAFSAPDGARTELVAGGQGEFWVANATGPGFAADALVQGSVRSRFEPFFGTRLLHTGKAGAWGARIGVPWDENYHWGFRAGVTFEVGGIH